MAVCASTVAELLVFVVTNPQIWPDLCEIWHNGVDLRAKFYDDWWIVALRGENLKIDPCVIAISAFLPVITTVLITDTFLM